ncbi:Stromal cell-derived factor 2-like protein 1 [Dissophora globulifera]|uniref:Stromal cell-derived factor 2-like protein 1 n=1 Tax=Dissophora globulifera TaxID=979702 RepID=A0A9P6R6R2_9FUNG|nr:Stromal cell-derived factor 2-like protein 1 [Dissophora globulifera]
MSAGLEVSAYEGQDDGDNWIVECANTKDTFWMREAPVRLRHDNTGMFLTTSSHYVYGNPIPGQQEVAAHRRNAGDQTWATQEGIYFAEREL